MNIAQKLQKIGDEVLTRKKEDPESDFEQILVDLGIPRGSQNRQTNGSKNSSKNRPSKKLRNQRKRWFKDLSIYQYKWLVLLCLSIYLSIYLLIRYGRPNQRSSGTLSSRSVLQIYNNGSELPANK